MRRSYIKFIPNEYHEFETEATLKPLSTLFNIYLALKQI